MSHQNNKYYILIGITKTMFSIEKITLVLFLLISLFFLIKFFKALFFGQKKKIRRRISTKKRSTFLPAKTKAKAERKYRKILAEFKRKHRRKPTKDDLFRVVITASHYTFPVKGRNVRRWTKGNRGHWNRQKVRKYLLEKHNIVKNYKMR